MLNRVNYFISVTIALCAFVCSMVITPLYAQQRARKNDTIVIHRQAPEVKPATPALAANLIIPTADKKQGYSHVPLAGEKSYFGDKNDYVNEFVRKYLSLHYGTLSNVLNNSVAPFSVMDNELEKKKMPKELKYLAVIESALNHNAVSHAGAVGPWQLMEATAKMLGLSVSRRVDERRDLYKSTLAATKYLEILYSQLDDWLLVIAAYNSGPTPVQKAIALTGSRNFWDIKKYLPMETQGHVLAFIATATIFENLSKFISLGSIPLDFQFGKTEDPAPAIASAPIANKNLNAKPTAGTATSVAAPPPVAVTPVAKSAPYTDEELKNMTIIRITNPLNLELVAQEIGVDKRILARWNPDYDMFVYSTYPTPFYNLRLPKDKQEIFLKKKEQLTKKSKEYFSANK